MTRICADAGSTHNGSFERAKELIKIGADIGLDAVKFQILTPEQCQSGNIMLPWQYMADLVEYGRSLSIDVFASIFSLEGYTCLANSGARSIKISHGMQAWALQCLNLQTVSANFENVYYSSGIMDRVWPIKSVRLYCIPVYPVPYVVDFEGLFQGRFQGFSSHCLGIQQEIRAVEAGAQYLEFHIRGTWDSPCPDQQFAKHPTLAEELCRKIKG